MDMRFGGDLYDSFVRYQTRVIRTLDQLAAKYGFVTLNASKPADFIFAELQRQIATLGLLVQKSRQDCRPMRSWLHWITRVCPHGGKEPPLDGNHGPNPIREKHD